MKQTEANSYQRVDLEALTPAYNMVRMSTLPSLLSSSLVVGVMWPQVNHTLLLAWGMLIALGLAMQHLLAKAFLHQEKKTAHVARWGWMISAVYFYFGLLWSSAIFMFTVNAAVEYQFFLITLVVTLSMGTIVAGQYWFPMYYLYGPITLMAVIVRLLMEGETVYYALAVLLLLSGLGTASFARKLHNMVRTEIRYRHESEFLHKALLQKAEEAHQAVQDKSKFLAAASHDLRQPLHSLTLFFDILKEANSDSERKMLHPKVDASLEAMRKLFDALLDMSHLEARVTQVDIRHIELSRLVKDITNEFVPDAEHKDLKLRVYAQPLAVHTDSLLLERILRNLLSNALRYTIKGGVLVSCRSRSRGVLLQVWDTGSGIPEESYDDVFCEFRQLDSNNGNSNEGLGLGLSLVSRMSKLLDHPLSLKSVVGKGTTFSLLIPHGNSDQIQLPRTESLPQNWDMSGRRILVIDDKKDILLATQALLSKWRCEVLTAESLEEALELLQQSHMSPELILSDLNLGYQKNGIDAIDALRERFQWPIPGILITGDTAAAQLKTIVQGKYEILQKPVRPIHLRAVIQTQLVHSSQTE